MLSNSYFTPGS